MMKEKTLFEGIKKIFSRPKGMAAEEFRFVSPFYVMVLLMLGVVYYVSVTTQPELQSIGRLSAFTFLIVLHGVLHWQSIVLLERPRWDVYYVFVQSVIALLIVYMVDELGLGFGVVAAMIGEIFGIFRKKRGVAFLIIGLLLVGTFLVIQIAGQETLPNIGFVIIFVVLFVVIFVELYSRQAEAREQAQGLLRELEVAHLELSEYSERVGEMTLIAERERMAFELHDTLGQGVAGLVLQLEAVKNHLENGRAERAEEIVTQAMGKARSTLAESRAVIDDLREIKMDVSLKELLSQMVDDFSESNQIPVEVQLSLNPEDLDVSSLVLEHIGRIVSEVFFNITQHAQATNVILGVLGNQDKLMIEIKDDGIGFDAEEIEKVGSYGLLGIRERAQRMRGTLEVESQSKQGTTIKVEFPLNGKGV